jgi:ferredoxin
MAYKIIETCTACGLCLPECPIDAIEAGEPYYAINDTCCDFEDCLAVCPVDAIIVVDAESQPDPDDNIRLAG